MTKKVAAELNDESGEVWKAVENTIVDWTAKTQINPNTGEVYDFHGVLLVPAVKEKK